MVKADKMVVFDMDGTIADFYGVSNWLTDLQNENPRPYIEAKPLYNMKDLNAIVRTLQLAGFRIAITSWLAKNSSPEYKELVRKAKREWLEKYEFPFDEIHLVQYGTTKADCTRGKAYFQILVDDNEQVRNGWSLGTTINANENILKNLISLLDN